MKKQKFKKRWLIAPGIVLGLGILIGVPTTTILLTQQQNNNKNPTPNQNNPTIQSTPTEDVKDDSNQENKNLMGDSNKENEPNKSLKNDDNMNSKPSETKKEEVSNSNPTPQNPPKESDNVSTTPSEPSSESQPIREETEVENGTTNTSPKPSVDESRPNMSDASGTEGSSSQTAPDESTSSNTNENTSESNTSSPTNDADDQGSTTDNEPPSSDSGVVTENNTRTEPYFVLSETKIPRDESRNTKYNTMSDLYKKLPIDLKLKQYYYKKLSQFDFLTNEEIDVLIRQLQPLTSGSVLHNNVEEINNPFINRFDEKEKYDSIVSVLVDDTKTPDVKFEIVNEYLPTLETLENVNDIYKTSLSHVSDTTLRAYVRNTTRTNNTIFRNTIHNFDPNAIENKLSNLVNKLKELQLDFIQPIIDFYERLITQNNGNNQELEKIYNHLNDLIFGSFWNNSGKSGVKYDKYENLESYKSIFDGLEGYSQFVVNKDDVNSIYYSINQQLQSENGNWSRNGTPWRTLTEQDLNDFKSLMSKFSESNSLESLKTNLTTTNSYDKIILHPFIKTYFVVNKTHQQWNNIYATMKVWFKTLNNLNSTEWNTIGFHQYNRFGFGLDVSRFQRPGVFKSIRENIEYLKNNDEPNKVLLKKLLQLILYALEQKFVDNETSYHNNLTTLLENFDWNNINNYQQQIDNLFNQNQNKIFSNEYVVVDRANWKLISIIDHVKDFKKYDSLPTKIPLLDETSNLFDANLWSKLAGDGVAIENKQIYDEILETILSAYGTASQKLIEKWGDDEYQMTSVEYEIIQTQVSNALKQKIDYLINKYNFIDVSTFNYNGNAWKNRQSYQKDYLDLKFSDEDLKLLLEDKYNVIKESDFFNEFTQANFTDYFKQMFDKNYYDRWEEDVKQEYRQKTIAFFNEFWVKPRHDFDKVVIKKEGTPKFTQTQKDVFINYVSFMLNIKSRSIKKDGSSIINGTSLKITPETIIGNLLNKDVGGDIIVPLIRSEIIKIFVTNNSTWDSYKEYDFFNSITRKYRERFKQLYDTLTTENGIEFYTQFLIIWKELLNEELVQQFIQKIYKWDMAILSYIGTYKILEKEYVHFSSSSEDEGYKKEFMKHFFKGEFTFNDRSGTEFVITDPDSTNPIFSTLFNTNIPFIKHVLTNNVKNDFVDSPRPSIITVFENSIINIIKKYSDSELQNIFGSVVDNVPFINTLIKSTGLYDSSFIYNDPDWSNAPTTSSLGYRMLQSSFNKFVEKMKQHNIQPLSDDEINNL